MTALTHAEALSALQREVVACERCRRLRAHCSAIARTKRRAYRDWDYWGKPLPSFGDPDARLLLLGLAPGAHGANRTGRMFTGDSSGDFLFDALHETGFASQPTSVTRDDGLRLAGCYVSAAVRCAPPQNRPRPGEVAACRDFLDREIGLLPRLRAVLALGRLAMDTYLTLQRQRGVRFLKKDFPFGHGALHRLPAGPLLVCSYHPSRQNTQTGRLTKPMMLEVLQAARRAASLP